MFKCPKCDRELLVEHQKPGVRIRCARCGHIHEFKRSIRGTKISDSFQRARLSLWLGLTTFVLAIVSITVIFWWPWLPVVIGGFMVVLGFMAVRFGIQSLLNMRFERPRKGEKTRSIIGAVSGGLFGILTGSTILLIGGLVSLILWTLVRTTDATEIRSMLSQVADVNLPEEMIGTSGTRVLNSQTILSFEDHIEFEKKSAWIRVQHFSRSLQINRPQFERQLESHPGIWSLRRIKDEDLSWNIAGKTQIVRHLIYDVLKEDASQAKPDFQFHQYILVIEDEHGLTGIAFTIKSPPETYSESEIRSTFESFQPK